jgi:EAL domain-containing protein (putative c-di-GMP-specific phosphodiesterase class I)
LDRRELAREIRLAIVNKEFEPYFQPQFDARDFSIVGVETLVRWESPKFGILTPNTFLPIAQQLSAVDEIDEMILEKGIKKISSLRDHDILIPKVSFNVTAERIQNQKLFTNLERLSKLGLKISFEVLESVLVEEQTDIFNHCLDRLREIGISIEIDDFGSGHASIVGLMHLRPDVMKIDQRLVMPITDSETTKGMLEQIVGMAQLMGLRVTAEGVETMEHARILSDLGCHTLQGYAFSKAIPIDELRRFVEEWQPDTVRSKVS